MEKKGKITRSFAHAFSGLKKTYKSERNFKIHIFSACLVLLLCLFLGISRLEWVIILLVISMVIALEMVNTALEKIVDAISLEKKQILGDIKDISAGAVLVISLISVITGLLILGPPLMELLPFKR